MIIDPHFITRNSGVIFIDYSNNFEIVGMDSKVKTQEERNYDSDEHIKEEDQNRFTESTTEAFNFSCTHPWEEMVIGADGRVGLCCLDYELSAEVGNIYNNSLKAIWQGEEMNKYRALHEDRAYYKISACKECNAHTFQKDKLWAKLQN